MARRRYLHGAAAGLTAALVLLAPAGATAKVRVSAQPSLTPAFSRHVTDYVSRCLPGKPLRFAVRASGGDRVAVGGKAARGGDFNVSVSRAPGAAVTIRVTSGKRTTAHHVRCLPQDFPRYEVFRKAAPQAAFYVLTPIGSRTNGYVSIFDTHGVPVWWMYESAYGPWDAKLVGNGHVVWSRQYNDRFGLRPKEAVEEHRLDGRTVRVLRTKGSPTDMHEAIRLPNGHYLLDTYRRRSGVDLSAHGGPEDAVVYDAEIQELTGAGKLVWTWSSKDHIALSETTDRWWPRIVGDQQKLPAGRRAYDIVHINSIEPDGDGLVVSARFLDAVFRIDRATGAVTWKLGGTKRAESLKVEGDPYGSDPLAGQHDARVYTDGSVTVHDNGTLAHRGPRAVRYRIDTQARTAKLLEDLRPRKIASSGWGGSARKLPTGNWVMYWGGSDRMSERRPSGRHVFDIVFKGGRHSYRAYPVLRGPMSIEALRRGMDAMARDAAGSPGR